MKDRSSRDRIPSGDLTAYERWELPLLDENGQQKPSVRPERGRVKPLTAEDLETIHNEAWEDGHSQGFETGKKEGMDQGIREGYKVGHEEGLTAGREEGYNKGLEEAREEIRQQQARLENVMGQLLKPIEQQEEATEAAMLNLVMALTRAVVRRELTIQSEQVVTLVREALHVLPNTQEQVSVRVNPVDYEAVKAAAAHYESDTRVISDDAVHAGGCLVENNHTLVDYTVEKRFQKVVQAMLDQQMNSGDTGEHGDLDAVMGELSDYHREVLETPDDDGAVPTDARAAEAPDEAESSRSGEPPASDEGQDDESG